MIVHYAQGGLGNQLFNYASARSLADRVGTDLLIDCVSYRDQCGADATRPFLLRYFPVRSKFRNLGGIQTREPLYFRILRRLNEDVLSVHIERPPHEIAYFKAFSVLGKRAVLKGHFVDYRFFSWNANKISDDLRMSENFLYASERGRSLLADIQSARCPVGIHVRRGDLLEPGNRWLLLEGVERYYRNAMHAMQERYPAANFLIFSDDPEWCREKFQDEPFDTTVIDSGDDPVEGVLVDFFLMNSCKHNIVSNSAFSWWAAWLNNNPQKTIMAPYKYDNYGSIPVDQFVLPEWQKVTW